MATLQRIDLFVLPIKHECEKGVEIEVAFTWETTSNLLDTGYIDMDGGIGVKVLSSRDDRRLAIAIDDYIMDNMIMDAPKFVKTRCNDTSLLVQHAPETAAKFPKLPGLRLTKRLVSYKGGDE